MRKLSNDKDFLGQITFEPLTEANWHKFVELFGNKGVCGNCWCMYHRRKKMDFEEGKAEGGNKEVMQNLVREHKPAGIPGFYEEQPIAWCVFAPGEYFIKLENSRVHKRIDNNPFKSFLNIRSCHSIDIETQR